MNKLQVIVKEICDEYKIKYNLVSEDWVMILEKDDIIKYILGLLLKKSVKIAISESNGQYYITMYYDNGYNKANGEDL